MPAKKREANNGREKEEYHVIAAFLHSALFFWWTRVNANTKWRPFLVKDREKKQIIVSDSLVK